MATITHSRSIHPAWSCEINVSPARLHEGSQARAVVTLSHPALVNLPVDDYADFYGQFTYQYRLNGAVLREGGHPVSGNPMTFRLPAGLPEGPNDLSVTVIHDSKVLFEYVRDNERIYAIFIEESESDSYEWPRLPRTLTASTSITVIVHHHQETIPVRLQRSLSPPTRDEALWAAIRNRTAAVAFPRYQRFIDKLLVNNEGAAATVQTAKRVLNQFGVRSEDRPLGVFGPHAYSVLKLATQAFLTLECGIAIRDHDAFGDEDDALFDDEHEGIRMDEEGITPEILERRLLKYLGGPEGQPLALPYLKRIVNAFISLDEEDRTNGGDDSPFADGVLRSRLVTPSMLELIWSYWLEEGMLAQTINAIALRFQNRRSSPHDPLGELEFDPLRPLNNLLWGYIQDEHNRLTVSRRAYEYQHHYGLTLQGKAVSGVTPADTRSKFIEAFHNLLYRVSLFYREDRDTTVIADAFPLLNALKEVHLILAEGAHNQFGDLTWTARGEMLINQWMLARPEMREFLRGRYMVPYQEGWMGAVDSMKKLQGWTDTSVTHFHELASTGERILLSIRYGDWVNINNIEEQAKNWARSSKPEIQRYLHGYQAVTGVDLAAETTETQDGVGRVSQPSKLLQRRLMAQRSASLGRPHASMQAIKAPTTAMKELPPVRPAQKYLADK